MRIATWFLIIGIMGLCGCGNIATTSKGWGLSLGSGTMTIRLGSWESTGVIVRENSLCEITSAASVVADSGTNNAPTTASSLDELAAKKENANVGNTSGITVKLVTGMQTSQHLTNILTAPTTNPNAAALAKTIFAADLERAKHIPESVPTGSSSTTTVGRFSAIAKTLQRMGDSIEEADPFSIPPFVLSADNITLPAAQEPLATIIPTTIISDIAAAVIDTPMVNKETVVAPEQPVVIAAPKRSAIGAFLWSCALWGGLGLTILLFKKYTTKSAPVTPPVIQDEVITGSTEPAPVLPIDEKVEQPKADYTTNL